MGYNKDNFRRIRAAYETKALEAEQAADMRRRELYLAIPSVEQMDQRLSEFGLRVMRAALDSRDTEREVQALREEHRRLAEARAALLRENGYPENYSDVRYECEQCQDRGYVGIRMCSCMKRRLVEAGMASSGMAELLRTQSFDNFSLDYYRQNAEQHALMTRNLQTVRRYAEGFSMEEGLPVPQNLLFLGGTGLGKTHLSSAVARTVVERGYDVFYNTAVGMLSDFEFRRFGNGLASGDGDNTEHYIDCDLLILDDLGTEVVNQFTLSCLYHVFNTRINLRRPTVVSTNLTAQELRKTYSDRITSRLLGEFLLIPFYGTDVRKQKLQNS